MTTPRARLLEQGAHPGTIDAFAAEIRRLEASTIASLIRRTAGDRRFSLGDVDPEIMERIAREIER